MTVTVRLFAMFREQAGSDSIEVELPDGATVAEALAKIDERPELGGLLDRVPVAFAVNRHYADSDTALAAGDELALVPPVSGGSGDASVHARVTEEPLSLEALSTAVSGAAAGAIVIFQGTTREVTRLDYEAYGEMAEQRIEAILRDCLDRHGLVAAAAEHRVGPVTLGESSVIVAVSAAHRSEAFDGAREAIDRIKAEAPIWKREVETTRNGEQGRWVEGTVPPPEGQPTASQPSPADGLPR